MYWRSKFLVLFAFMLIAAACGGDDAATTTAAPQPAEPIRIGVAIDETGWTSVYDQPNKIGLELGVADINAAGGINGRQVELVYAVDHGADPIKSQNAAVDLISKGVDVGVVTCDFDVAGPAALEFNNAGIVSFSVCASSLLFGPKGQIPLAFSSGDSAAGFASGVAEYGYKEEGWRTAYILLDNTIAYTAELCESFKARWEALGGTIVGEDQFTQGDESISTQITRIKDLAEEPDVIRLCTYFPGIGSYVNQIRTGGITSPIAMASEADGTYWHDGVPNLSDIYYAAKGSIYGDDSIAAINDFYARFEAASGAPPTDGIGVGGYMIIETIKLAAERAGTLEGQALLAELEKFDNEALLQGPTSFSVEFHTPICRSFALMIGTAQGENTFVTRYAPEIVALPESVGGGTLIC
jgi:branched-chain amino acid transport system substrate-binding protein